MCNLIQNFGKSFIRNLAFLFTYIQGLKFLSTDLLHDYYTKELFS